MLIKPINIEQVDKVIFDIISLERIESIMLYIPIISKRNA